MSMQSLNIVCNLLFDIILGLVIVVPGFPFPTLGYPKCDVLHVEAHVLDDGGVGGGVPLECVPHGALADNVDAVEDGG
eukprot:368695-Hanusia_phi.AAC.1